MLLNFLFHFFRAWYRRQSGLHWWRKHCRRWRQNRKSRDYIGRSRQSTTTEENCCSDYERQKEADWHDPTMVSALVVACRSWFEFEVHSTYQIVKQSFLLRKQVRRDATSVNFCKSFDKKMTTQFFFIFQLLLKYFVKKWTIILTVVYWFLKVKIDLFIQNMLHF